MLMEMLKVSISIKKNYNIVVHISCRARTSGSACEKLVCSKNKVTKFGRCLVFLTALEPCGASGPTH